MTNPFADNKHEICWQIINCGIAGGLVLLGALAAGDIDKNAICAAGIAALIVFFTQFRQYWQSQMSEYKGKKGSINLMSFV